LTGKAGYSILGMNTSAETGCRGRGERRKAGKRRRATEARAARSRGDPWFFCTGFDPPSRRKQPGVETRVEAATKAVSRWAEGSHGGSGGAKPRRPVVFPFDKQREVGKCTYPTVS
jgi:hypothetical protein